jgi:hypothetical protein
LESSHVFLGRLDTVSHRLDDQLRKTDGLRLVVAATLEEILPGLQVVSVVSSPENRKRESLKPHSRLRPSIAIADGSLDVVASLLDETGLERPSKVAAVGSDEPCPADPFIDCRLVATLNELVPLGLCHLPVTPHEAFTG